MDAKAKSLRFLGEGKKLTVPFFQRSYVWNKDNWAELLDSFDTIESRPFLGSIILKNVTAVLQPEEKIIIDGQQRLTTITILAKALYDSLPQDIRPGSGIEDDLKNFLFYKVNASDSFSECHVKIQHSRLDDEAYQTVIRAGLFKGCDEIDCTAIHDDSSCILRCYKYYRNALKDRTVSELKTLHNAMFSEEHKVFVLIELEYNDINEQSIFDTINRAGVRLSSADIIKNNLFKLCLDKCSEVGETKEAVGNLYDVNWNDLFYADEVTRQLWDEKRVFGNVERTNLEFLLYCVAVINWGKDKDIFSQLEKVYSDHTEDDSYEQLTDLIKEINMYGRLFKTYILDFKSDLSSLETTPTFYYTDYVSHLLLILECFGVQMFYPYVLKRIADVDGNFKDTSLIHDFKVLESFVVRRRLSSRGVTDYAAKCHQMLHETDGLKNALIVEMASADSATGDPAFVDNAARVKNREAAKILLFCIELYRRRDPKHDINSLQYNFTLEHVMPQKWEQNWSTVPICDADGVPLQDDEEKRRRTRKEAVDNIGNMVLLKDRLNKSVSNGDFEKKVKGDKKHSGYEGYASLYIVKDIVDTYNSGNTIWNEKSIYDRQHALMKEALEIWPSFAQECPPPPPPSKEIIMDSKMSVDDFSDEAFKDPLKLIDELESMTADVADMLDQESFIQKLSVHSETIERYIREGKIVPDAVISLSEHRQKNYFKPESVTKYAKQYGWEEIHETDLLQLFTAMVEKMKMSYSYKPIFLNAIFSVADANGIAALNDIVAFFRAYFDSRRKAGLVVEKPDSIFAKETYSNEEAKKIILIYPYARFAEMGMMTYDCISGTIRIHRTIWNHLDSEEKKRICKICDQKLDAYFSTLA